MKSKIKLLLYCGLMIMTLNAFALNIDTWSKPVEFHSNNHTISPGEVWGSRLPIIVGGNKIVYIGYDRIKYQMQYDVLYRVCELDKNTGIQKLVKQTSTKDYTKIVGLIAQSQFNFFYETVAVPNSNSFIDFLFLGNSNNTVKKTMYRVGTIQTDDSIIWSELKELNLNMKNKAVYDDIKITVTPNKNIVFLTREINYDFNQITTAKLKTNTYGELEIGNIKTDEIEWVSNTRIINVKNKYIAMFFNRDSVKLGKFNETGTIDWEEPQYLDYKKVMSIDNQLAIENSDSNGSFITFYKINSNMTISKDEESETMNLPSMCKNEYDWDVNWIEGEDKLLTTVYDNDDVNRIDSIYYSEANIVNKL